MFQNGQFSKCLLLRQFNSSGRGFAAKSAKKSKATTALNNESNSTTVKGREHEVPLAERLNASFLTRVLGSTYRKWSIVLDKHPELKSLKQKDIISATNTLKMLKYDMEAVLTNPRVLHINALTIENRHTVLQECGFKPIDLPLLAKFLRLQSKTVTVLKSFRLIPFKVNTVDRLKSCFTDVDFEKSELEQCKEEMEIKLIREHIMSLYFRKRLGMNDADVKKVWQIYGRVRHRSFKSVQLMCHVLLDELQISKERIINNSYILHGDPMNVRRIVNEIKTINGVDIRDIVYKRPKILMSSCDALLQTLEYVKQFGITEDAIIRCVEVLTLGPNTVLERLRDLNEIKEFQVLGNNPRVLRLVHYQNKARIRLEYLNQLKMRCASLHILSGGSEKFSRFARGGGDHTKGCDVVVYLANGLNKKEQEIRDLLSRHPNWCHIPLVQVKECLDFLCDKKFSEHEIFNNIHILLYPIKRIEETSKQLKTQEMLNNLNLNLIPRDLTKNEFLTLILYLIERDFHFTGDGIWADQYTQPVENFNNLLPDFPEGPKKAYKYGVKPADTNTTDSVAENAHRAELQLLHGR